MGEGRRQGFAINPPPPSNGRVERRAEILCSISGLSFPLPEPTALPPTPPPRAEFSFFFAFNFGFEFLLFFKPLPNLPKPPKIAQKASKNLPKTPPKLLPNRISSCNARNLKKIRPSHTKPSFLTFPGLRKSFQNRYQNAFIIDSLLDALLEPPKLRIWMLKRRQDGPLKFHDFYKNPLKILTIPVFRP